MLYLAASVLPKNEDIPCDMTVGRMRMQFDNNATQQQSDEAQDVNMSSEETSQGKLSKSKRMEIVNEWDFY